MAEQLDTAPEAPSGGERHPIIEIMKRDLREKVAFARETLAEYEIAIAAEPDNDARIDAAGERFSILASQVTALVRSYRTLRDVQGFS